jgi:hypothetical protein
MAIQPWEQKIGVTSVRGARLGNVPNVADVSEATTRLGQQVAGAVTKAVEPYARKEAEDAAMRAVGSKEIVKDERGFYARPDTPGGGGLVYNEVFDKAMNRRYANLVTKDFENQADSLAMKHFTNPEALQTELEGRARAILDTAPPDMVLEIEEGLTREMSERVRGVSNRKASLDWQAQMDGLEQSYRLRLEKAAKIRMDRNLAGVPEEREARARVEDELAFKDIEALVELGAIGPKNLEVFTTKYDMMMKDAREVGVSWDAQKKYGNLMDSMSIDQKSLFVMWLDGLDPGEHRVMRLSEGTIVTFDDVMKDMPSATVREVLSGQITGQQTSERQALREAEMDRRYKEQLELDRLRLQKDDKILKTLEDNFSPEDGSMLTKEQKDAFETKILARGTVESQLFPAPNNQGPKNTLLTEMIQYGHVPKSVRNTLDMHAVGGRMSQVTQIVNSLR